MRQKLSRIRKPWQRLLLTVIINTLLLISKFKSPRARAHWVGHYRRRRRFERPVIALLFGCAIVLLEPHQLVYWSALIGGFTSIYIILHSAYLLIPRRRSYHWINK